MKSLLHPRNLLISVLGAAVLGLCGVVAVDHTMGVGAQTQPASLAAATSTAGTGGHEFGPGARFGMPAARVLGFFTKDTGLTLQQIAAQIRAGKTLDEIAGPSAAKVAADALAEVRSGLDIAVHRGALTSSQEASLLSDARDAISVLMAAKLGALIPAA